MTFNVMLRWCLAALLVVSTIQFLMMKQQVNRLEIQRRCVIVV